MKGVSACLVACVACVACGRVGFGPIGGSAGDDDPRIDAPGVMGEPPAVTSVVPLGAEVAPYPIWDGESFVLISATLTETAYQAFSETGTALGARTVLPGVGFFRQSITTSNGIGILNLQPGTNVVALALVDRNGTLLSNNVVSNLINTRIAKNLDRDELCMVWADPDGNGSRSVRAARMTPTGVKLGTDLTVITLNRNYRRLDVACRGDELYVLYTVEDAGWWYYYLSTYNGTTSVRSDLALAPPTGVLSLLDVILLAPNLASPLVVHGAGGTHILLSSFDVAAPAPLESAEIGCNTQAADAEWDGQNVQLATACVSEALEETVYQMGVTANGALMRPAAALHTSPSYGGGAYQVAISPDGHLALGFSEWDLLNERQLGYIGFLAP